MSARQNRPIVYSASHYRPDVEPVTIASHLYRVEPDGSRHQQITHGPFDDMSPRWSPSGERIAFARSRRNPNGVNSADTICLVDGDGGAVRTVFRAADDRPLEPFWIDERRLLIRREGDHSFDCVVIDLESGSALSKRVRHMIAAATFHDVSPDRSHLVVGASLAPDGCTDGQVRIVRLSDGREIRLPGRHDGPAIWIDSERLVSVEGFAVGAPLLKIFSRSGKLVSSREITMGRGARAWWGQVTQDTDAAYDNSGEVVMAAPLPGQRGSVLIGRYLSTMSDEFPAAYLRVDVAQAVAMPGVVADALVVAPDGRSFLSRGGRTLAVFGTRAKPLGRAWIHTLQLGAMRQPPRLREIVPGTVYINSFDWRPT